MSGREPTEGPPDVAAVRAAVWTRLSGARLAHVEAVAETAAEIAEGGGWPDEVRAAAERAAWWHDALKPDGPAAWRRAIEAAGESPDPWALAHRRELLHAPAAAVWAAAHGETDTEVLAAVRYHPTGHPGWGPVGRLLYVADFCEPTRGHAERIGAAALRARAREGATGLAETARDVLGIRIAFLLERRRKIHPRSLEAWNAWAEDE